MTIFLNQLVLLDKEVPQIYQQMTTYIAQFIAKHRIVQVQQNSVFTWRQEGGDIDESLLADKIKRESALLFYQLVAGRNYPLNLSDIAITVLKTEIY